MMRGESSGGVRRWLADFAFALSLFWAVIFTATFAHTHAHALPALARQAAVSAPLASQAAARPDRPFEARPQARPRHALLLFSLAFAAMAAFNLAIWRHLRRVYASQRRSGWRRG
jgi:hypothetical protein